MPRTPPKHTQNGSQPLVDAPTPIVETLVPRPVFLQAFGAAHAETSDYKRMIDSCAKRHGAYCERHGYRFIVAGIDDPVNWNKFRVIRDLLLDPAVSHLFYVDADAVVAQTAVDMREALGDGGAWLGMTIHPYPTDRGTFHLQVGVMYWRACPEAVAFLDAVLAREGDGEHSDPYGKGEQGALNYEMLYGARAAEFQSGLRILPHVWNANVHNQRHADAIVGAFHGCPDRLKRVREYVARLELIDGGTSAVSPALGAVGVPTGGEGVPMSIENAIREAYGLAQGGMVAEAEAVFKAVLAIDRNQLDAMREYGKLLASNYCDRYEEAVPLFAWCCAQEPAKGRNAYLLANTYAALNDRQKAGRMYEHLLAIEPHSPYYQWCASMHALGTGDWAAGWERYWRGYVYRVPRARTWSPQWAGAPGSIKSNQTLFVCAEQGHGDMIFFSRWLPRLRELLPHAKIVVECHDAVLPLFVTLTEKGLCDQVVVFDALNWDFSTPFDHWVSIGSLPHLLGGVPDEQTHGVMVMAEHLRDVAAPWRTRAANDGRFRVGVQWRGSAAHPEDKRRSFDWSVLARVLDQSGIHRDMIDVVNLQYGPVAEECTDTSVKRMDVSTTDRAVAAIAECDFVISCDTFLTNVAGVLGVSGAVLVAVNPDWRWMFSGERSPWAPSIGVCRQEVAKDWTHPTEDAAVRLAYAYGAWFKRQPKPTQHHTIEETARFQLGDHLVEVLSAPEFIDSEGVVV